MKYHKVILDSLSDMVIGIDNDLKIIYVNQATKTTLGYLESEIIGLDILELFKNDSKKLLNNIKESNQKESLLELEMISKNGNSIWVESSINQLRDQKQANQVGFVFVLREINERKYYQEQLDIFNRELLKYIENEVKNRLKAEHEKKLQERLLIQQSKMAAMGEMLGAIIHQWKQPINSISLLVQMQLSLFENDMMNEDSFKKFSKDILEQIDFMMTTMDGFRSFFKPSKEIVKMGIKKEIENIISLIFHQFSALNITIELIGDEIECFGYPNEFKQVVLNILTNSKDAFIERKIEDRKIKIELFKDKDFAIATFKDNAGGIAEWLLPDKIFENYVSTKGDKGTGIGLAISKTIIEKNMHGSLSAQNVENGAMFCIKLPLR